MRLSATVVILIPLLFAAAGCTYELKGRVLETGFDTAVLVPADDARLREGDPIGGARLTLIRDPDKLNRADVATAVASREGWFTLQVEEFGSGWMEEQWGLRVERSGYGSVEAVIELPFDPKTSALLVNLVRATAGGRAPSPAQAPSPQQELDRYWPSGAR